MHDQIVLFDGFDPIDVLAPYEVLHIAGGLTGGRITVEFVSAEGPGRLVGTGAVTNRARVVDDGDLISSGVVTSGIDLALHLVEREVGSQVAAAIETIIRHERRGTGWRSADAPAVVAS